MVNSDDHQTMIDDCGDADMNSEKSIGFLEEWINTYVFLSREFFLPFFFYYFPLFPFIPNARDRKRMVSCCCILLLAVGICMNENIKSC